MGKSDDPIVEVEVIEGEVLPEVTPGKELHPLVEALNPLGPIGRTIADLVAYRAASRQLTEEQALILEQAEAVGQAIEERLSQELHRLKTQREAVLDHIAYMEEALRESRATREALMLALDDVTKAMSEPGVQIEALSYYQDALKDIASCLAETRSRF